MEKRKIEVYIDGSSVDVNAKKRPKGTEPVFPEWHGAYAGVFYVDGQEVMRMKGYEKGGTIGKMELSALVQGLQALIDQRVLNQMHLYVTIYSDSQYVVNGATKWWRGWKKKGYKDIKFRDLWNTYTIQILGFVKLDICWNKGHSGIAGNELADKLANEALGAGITGWKVSGKERFLLFDKVENFENAVSDGCGFTHEEAGPFPVITEQMRKDADEFVKFGEKGFTTKQQIEEYKKAEPLFREQEKKLWFPDDNDFTDMAKKKPMKKSEEDEAEDYYQAIADYRKSHPIKEPTPMQLLTELVEEQEKIRLKLSTIIKKLQKENGTRSTKSNT